MKQLVVYNALADALQLITVLDQKVVWEYTAGDEGFKVRLEFEGSSGMVSLQTLNEDYMVNLGNL